MSRATIRAATATWFGGRPQPTRPSMYRDGPVAFLGTLWTSGPREALDEDFWPGTGQVSGAVCTIHLVSSTEHREAMGGEHSGRKRVDYQVYLETYFRSRQPRVEDATEDLDTFLDSLVDRAREDRTWGVDDNTFGVIWQAGEDITIDTGEPEWKDNRLSIAVAVQTTVTEWIDH